MDIRSSRGSSQPFPAGTLTMLLTDVEGSTKQWAERPDAFSAQVYCETVGWVDG